MNEAVVEVLEAPKFFPTVEEFADFEGYVNKIEPLVRSSGVCLVVPPKGWSPRKRSSYDDVDDVVVQKPIRQEFTGSKGVYFGVLLESRSQPLVKFRKVAEAFDKRYAPEFNRRASKAQGPSDAELERYYWKNIRFRRPTYGADVVGSLFDDDVKQWNPKRLDTVLDLVGGMPGVTVPYLYFGMYGASFAWHTEDMDLYSINYIHFGSSKTWYFIPQEQKDRFELLCKKLYASHFDDCKEFLRHKLAMLAPEVLVRNGIPYGKTIHRPGEFMLVFPGVYHAGFNNGFNCAESVNFATESWLEWGRKARACTCRTDTVSINCDVLEAMIKERKRKGAVLEATKPSGIPESPTANEGDVGPAGDGNCAESNVHAQSAQKAGSAPGSYDVDVGVSTEVLAQGARMARPASGSCEVDVGATAEQKTGYGGEGSPVSTKQSLSDDLVTVETPVAEYSPLHKRDRDGSFCRETLAHEVRAEGAAADLLVRAEKKPRTGNDIVLEPEQTTKI